MASKLELVSLGGIPHCYNRNVEVLLGSCHSLQKLRLKNYNCLNNNLWVQNGKTLQSLNLSNSPNRWNYSFDFDLKSIKDIVENCVELREVSFYHTDFHEDALNYLVNNLTPKVLRLDLSYIFSSFQYLGDEHVEKLVKRCTNLIVLKLSGTEITNSSIDSIIEHLGPSLKKLDVADTIIDYGKGGKLLELKKLMPNLKNFRADPRFS